MMKFLSLLSAFLILAASTEAQNIRGGMDEPDRELQQQPSGRIPLLPRPLTAEGCTYTPENFEADVVIELFGVPEEITDAEIADIEANFLASYNTEANSLCDPEFPRVTAVNVSNAELTEARRRLQSTTGTVAKRPARRFSFRFFILGTCRACGGSPRLFDDAFRRRDLQLNLGGATSQIGSIDSTFQGGRIQPNRYIDVPDIFGPARLFNCDCLDDQTSFVSRAKPSDVIVNSRFSAEIESANTGGSLPNINRSESIQQVVEVECPAPELDDFESEIVIQAEGDPEMLTDAEIALLADLFLDSYEVTSADICDPNFKVLTAVQDVSIDGISRFVQIRENPTTIPTSGGSSGEEGEFNGSENESFNTRGNVLREGGALAGGRPDGNRDLQFGPRRTIPPAFAGANPPSEPGATAPAPTPPPVPAAATGRFRPFQFRLTVKGKCRGCESTARLFDDAFRRLVESYTSPAISQRDLAFVLDNEICFCPINAPVQNVENEQFTVVYNEAIEEEAFNESFPNVANILQTIQVDDNIPSAAPSMMPSASPTAAPSIAQSAGPSADPSASPTDMPSASPSISPTAMPSISPSGHPSVMPTSLPSAFPSSRPSPTVPTESPVPSPSPSIIPTNSDES